MRRKFWTASIGSPYSRHDHACHRFCHCDWMHCWIQDVTECSIASEVITECLVSSTNSTRCHSTWQYSNPRDNVSFGHPIEHVGCSWYWELLTCPIITEITIEVLWLANLLSYGLWTFTKSHPKGMTKCARDVDERRKEDGHGLNTGARGK